MSHVSRRRYLWWDMNRPTTSKLRHIGDSTMIGGWPSPRAQSIFQISNIPASLLFLLVK
jgi:hypothetical protein